MIDFCRQRRFIVASPVAGFTRRNREREKEKRGETHPDSFHHEADVADAHEVGALVDGVNGLDMAGDLRGARRRFRVGTEQEGVKTTVCQQANEGELTSRNRKVSLPRPDPDDWELPQVIQAQLNESVLD